VNGPDRLEELARAVLDGAAVDWDAAECSANPDERAAIRDLRLLERLTQVHREEARAIEGSGAEPRRWGHLAIVGPLGRGAFGRVYRAWDPGLDREVALKLLTAPGPNGDRGPDPIIEEGRLLARIRHHNVVTVYGATQIGDEIGIWMELVSGQTLDERLQAAGPFSVAETIRVGIDLCRAVSAVHGANLLHRDIKAHNVMQAEDGRVVLMDLGAGRDVRTGTSLDLTGTPLYLSPEVLRGDEASVQSDIYALGVLLYYLLTGAYPVTGRTLNELNEAHAAGRHPRVRDRRHDVPAALAVVLERALHPEPSRRYPTAAAMAAELGAIGSRRPARLFAAAGAVAALAIALWGAVAGGSGPRGGPRLAVLPFDESGGGEAAFTRGLAREIQRNLAGLEGLVLLDSTASVVAVSDPVEAGRSLEADFVIDGVTTRSGDRVRVNARLLRIADGRVAWSSTYDRSVADILAILDDISRAIADQLRVTLRLPRRHDIPLDVYYEFLRAKDLQAHRGVDHLDQAAALFEQVIARAPEYAPAWAALATSLGAKARLLDTPYPERMTVAATRAIQLDEFQAEAQLAMGGLFSAARQWDQADAAFHRALDVDPSLTFVYTEFVLSSLLPQGRLDDALRYLDEAQRRAPLSLDVARVKALVLVEAGRYAEAIATAGWVLERDPRFPFANLWLGRAVALAGRPEDALRCYARQPGTEAYRGYALAVLGRASEAEQLAMALAAEPHRQMLIYGGLGDKERAFSALERVVRQNSWRAATWMIRPEVAILRDDPRYDVIRGRLGLPPHRSHAWRSLWSRLDVRRLIERPVPAFLPCGNRELAGQ
jgi:serine/threonine-protein kinase